MREQGMYDGPVYHIFAGPDLREIKVCSSYPEYLAYFAELKKEGKGTRYGATWFDRKNRIYHYYFRVVDEKKEVNMQTIYGSRVIFCSDKSNCMNCEFFFNCGAIPESEFWRVCKIKSAAIYGDSVGGSDEKPIS